MTQLDCELLSTITLSRPAVLHSQQGQWHAILSPLLGPPDSTLNTSTSGQWSQLMAFVWTNSLC